MPNDGCQVPQRAQLSRVLVSGLQVWQVWESMRKAVPPTPYLQPTTSPVLTHLLRSGGCAPLYAVELSTYFTYLHSAGRSACLPR